MRNQRAEQPLKLDGPEAARIFFADRVSESDPARECLWVAHVDQHGRCLHLSRHIGDEGSTPFPIRSIVADAARFSSSGVVLAHNHPSGRCQPSRSDCIVTRRLASTVQALGCAVLDHLIFADGRSISFRQLGLL